MSTPVSPAPGRGTLSGLRAIVVWVVWVVMTVNLLGFIYRYGRNVPFNDDHAIIPLLTGEEAVTPAQLWTQRAEHRLPVPTALFIGLFRLAGNDFRAVIFFNGLAMSLLALGMLRVAQQQRRATSYADTFFPLALLHWGHYQNLLWSWQIIFISSTVLAGVFLLLIVRYGNCLTPVPFSVAGAVLVLLPLCGMNGVALVPALAVWLCWAGVSQGFLCSARASRWNAALLALPVMGLCLVGVTFYALEKPALWYTPMNPGLTGYIRTTLQFLAGGFGLAPAGTWWPWSGFAMVGLVALGAAALLALWRRSKAERPRVLGLFFFLGAMLSLTAGLAIGRAGAEHNAGFQPRYVTLPVPLLCGLYFLAGMPELRAGRIGQAGLFFLAAWALPLNYQEGVAKGRRMRDQKEAVEQAIRAGIPVPEVAAYDSVLCPCATPEELAEHWRMLRRAGCGPFRGLAEEPPLRAVRLPVEQVGGNADDRNPDPSGRCGLMPYLTIALKQPQFVLGLRIRCAYGQVRSDSVNYRVFWRESGRNDFTEEARNARLRLGFALFRSAQEELADKEVTVWVNDTVDQFRIYPDDKPCAFRVTDIVFLVPRTEE